MAVMIFKYLTRLKNNNFFIFKNYRLLSTENLNKLSLFCFLIIVFFQASCVSISKKREIDSKNQTISKNKQGEKKINKKVRKTLSGHGKEAGESFLKKK